MDFNKRNILSNIVQTHKPANTVAPLPPDGALKIEMLLQWLLDDGIVSIEQAENTLKRAQQARSNQHALVRLANLQLNNQQTGKLMDIESLTQWLARHINMEYVRIDPLKVQVSKVAESMNKVYAERNKILPIQASNDEVVIACAEPFETQWIAELQRQTKRQVKRVLANPKEIERLRVEFYSLAKSVKTAQDLATTVNAPTFEQLIELGKGNKQIDANDQGIVQVVEWLWLYAFEQRASDIHIEPRREQSVVRFRIDGVLHLVYQLPSIVHTAITSRIKLLGRMDVIERRRPQDGRIKTRNAQGNEVEMRLSTLPTAFGEKLVMRIFNPETSNKDLASLGFNRHDSKRWEDLTQMPNGIILVTGPTGSGKTSTLYSTLKRLATEQVNVSTIEDPIEMIEPSLNQTQVQVNLDFSFAEGVRALMRQDPDIIMVGEIRDLPTAEMAVQAALTGHLVFSTLHTNDAPSAVSRLLELGIAPYLINATVLGILAQRLVRTLCVYCKEEDPEVTEETLKEVIAPWRLNAQSRAYKPVGCVSCRNTGFSGRMGIFELLTFTEEFKKNVHEHPNIDELRRQAVKDGMRPLRLAGALHVANGNTTLKEVLGVTPLH